MLVAPPPDRSGAVAHIGTSTLLRASTKSGHTDTEGEDEIDLDRADFPLAVKEPPALGTMAFDIAAPARVLRFPERICRPS